MKRRQAPLPKFIRPPAGIAPRIVYQSPYCGICVDDLVDTGAAWQCPNCGHQWDYDAEHQEEGTYQHPESHRARQPITTDELFDIPSVRHPDRRRAFIAIHNKP